jgi:hypothetical protein
MTSPPPFTHGAVGTPAAPSPVPQHASHTCVRFPSLVLLCIADAAVRVQVWAVFVAVRVAA